MIWKVNFGILADMFLILNMRKWLCELLDRVMKIYFQNCYTLYPHVLSTCMKCIFLYNWINVYIQLPIAFLNHLFVSEFFLARIHDYIDWVHNSNNWESNLILLYIVLNFMHLWVIYIYIILYLTDNIKNK